MQRDNGIIVMQIQWGKKIKLSYGESREVDDTNLRK